MSSIKCSGKVISINPIKIKATEPKEFNGKVFESEEKPENVTVGDMIDFEQDPDETVWIIKEDMKGVKA